MTRQSSAPAGHKPKAVAILLVPLVAAVILTLFAWPSARLEPRDLPIGVAGPAAAVAPMEQQLAEQEGAFDLERYAGEAAARDAIERREIYGAFVATPAGPKVLTASGGSAMVAQLLTHAADAAPGDGMPVEDVVVAPSRSGALASSVLPLVLAGILTGVVSAMIASDAARRTALLVTGSLLTGLAATAIVQSWLGVLGGDWAANAAALSLIVLAIAATLAGLKSLFGTPGLAAGAITMIFVGNPFSGVGTAPELLPRPVGGLGQLLPPGAGGNLLRSTGYFDGAGSGGHVAVLAAWALGGRALLLAAGRRARRAAAEPLPVAA
jgi:hypothetical protein